MSEPLPINEELRDALQEICNVAMGVAGESLAEFSGVFVELPIPKIRFLKPNNLSEALSGLQGGGKLSAVTRSFVMGGVELRALVAITDIGLQDLSAQRQVSVASEQDALALLSSLSDVITDSCLPMLAEQLEFDQPIQGDVESLGYNLSLEDFTVPQVAHESAILTAEINYHLEGHPFNCDLLLLIPEPSIDVVMTRLGGML